MKGLLTKIIGSLREDLKSTIEVAEELNLDRTYTSGCLQILCELGVLKRKKIGSNKIYQIHDLDSLRKLGSDL